MIILIQNLDTDLWVWLFSILRLSLPHSSPVGRYHKDIKTYHKGQFAITFSIMNLMLVYLG